jgi:MerR family transcriptional regulator, light-induced transcriptional regulator
MSMDDELLLTTRDAAALLGVGTTAVKRWADDGLVPCVRTAGGHRRFRARDLERLRQGGAAPPDGRPSDGLLDALLADSTSELIQARLLELRAREGSWTGTLPAVGAALGELGLAWARGEITVLEEHAASERLARALARIAESLPVPTRAPSGLLVCVEGDEHTLGLAMVELCLRESGWRARWAGRAATAQMVVDLVHTDGIDAVYASASSCSDDARALARWTLAVGRPCTAHGIPLVLGGRGAWPETSGMAVRIRDFDVLRAFAAGAAVGRRAHG